MSMYLWLWSLGNLFRHPAFIHYTEFAVYTTPVFQGLTPFPPIDIWSRSPTSIFIVPEFIILGYMAFHFPPNSSPCFKNNLFCRSSIYKLHICHSIQLNTLWTKKNAQRFISSVPTPGSQLHRLIADQPHAKKRLIGQNELVFNPKDKLNMSWTYEAHATQ